MKLKKAYVEITNICNLRCEFCKSAALADSGEIRSRGFMSVDNFSRVLTALSPYTNYVYLHVLGEPLLHPQLGALLEICESLGMKASITTNGSLLSEPGVEETLLDSPALRQINFSMHSLQGRCAFDAAENIFRFARCAAGASAPKYVVLRFWVENRNRLALLSAAAKFFSAESLFEVQNQVQKNPLHNYGNGIKIEHNIFLQQDIAFTWPDAEDCQNPRRHIFTRGTCYGLRHQIAVLVDGTVVPCCLDWQGAVRLGNIFEDSLADILSSERAENIRTGFRRREVREEFCKTCGFGVRLNGRL